MADLFMYLSGMYFGIAGYILGQIMFKQFIGKNGTSNTGAK